MITKFLKAKHWQMFLLIFGIPFLAYLLTMIGVVTTVGAGNEPTPQMLASLFMFFPLMMIIFVFMHFGWLYSVATGLQAKVPEGVKMKVRKFKVFFTIPLVYIGLIIFFLLFMMNDLESGNFISESFIVGVFAVVFPLHLFSIFCILYTMYFVAKTFKTAELQRKVSFSDFAGDFFLVWFLPIGIWIIQPKINRMVVVNQEGVEGG